MRASRTSSCFVSTIAQLVAVVVLPGVTRHARAAEPIARWVDAWQVTWAAADSLAALIEPGQDLARAGLARRGQVHRERIQGANAIAEPARGRKWVLLEAQGQLRWPLAGQAVCTIETDPGPRLVGYVAIDSGTSDRLPQPEAVHCQAGPIWLWCNGKAVPLPAGSAQARVRLRSGVNVLRVRALLVQPQRLRVRVASAPEQEALLERLDRIAADASEDRRQRAWAARTAATILTEQGDWFGLARRLERLALLVPTREERYAIWLRAAEAYARLGAVHRQARALEQALGQLDMYDPRYWPTLQGLIDLWRDALYRLSDVERCLRVYQRELGNGMHAAAAQIELARLWLNVGRTAEALDAYGVARGLARGSEARLELAIRLGRETAQAEVENRPIVRRSLELLAKLGQFQTRASEGRWAEALQALHELLEKHPDAVLEGSSVLAISARECVRRELATLDAGGMQAYERLYTAPLRAALQSPWADVLERFWYIHPFGPFQPILNEAIGDRLAAEGSFSRAASFYRLALNAVQTGPKAEESKNRLRAKAAFCRVMAGEPVGVLLEENPVVTVGGQQRRLSELVGQWRRESGRGPSTRPAPARLARLKHSRLPLLAVPRVVRKWQAGVGYGPRDRVRVAMAPEFVPYVPAGDADLVVVNTSETVHAFDPKQGRLLWTRGPSEANAADPPPRSLKRLKLGACAKRFTCAISADAVFFRLNWGHRATGQRRSAIFAVRRRDGALLWSTQNQPELAGLEFVSDPAYGAGTVVAAAWEPREIPVYLLVGFDAATGRLLWRTELFSGTSLPAARKSRLLDTILGSAPPTIADGVVYFCGGVGVLAAVGVHDGAIRWLREYPRRQAWGPDAWGVKFILSRPATPIVVVGQTVLVSPQDSDSLLMLDAKDGAIRRRYASMDLRCLVGADAQHAYVQTGTSVLALNLPRLDLAWRTHLDVSGILGSATLSGRGLIVPCWEGLYVLDPTDGKVLERLAWSASQAFGNVLDLGDRLVGASLAWVHLLAPEPYSEAPWRLPRTVRGHRRAEAAASPEPLGKGWAGSSAQDADGSKRLVKWILPAVDRGDCYFSLDAEDLMLLRAPDSVELRRRAPMPTLLWERATRANPMFIEFDRDNVVLAYADGELLVLDTKTGGRLVAERQESMRGQVIAAIPTGGQVLWVARTQVRCYDPRGRTCLWVANFPGWQVRGVHPLAESLVVYLQAAADGPQGVAAMAVRCDRTTGQVQQIVPIRRPGTAPSATTRLDVAVPGGGHSRRGSAFVLVDGVCPARVDVQAGKVLFGQAVTKPLGGRVELWDGYVCLIGRGGGLAALWRKDSLERVPVSSSAQLWHVADGVVYYTVASRLVAFDLAQQRSLWRSRTFVYRPRYVYATGPWVLVALERTTEAGTQARVQAVDRRTGRFVRSVPCLARCLHKVNAHRGQMYASDYTYLYAFGPPAAAGKARTGRAAPAVEDPDAIAACKLAADVEHPEAGTIALSSVQPAIDGDLDDWSGTKWVRLVGAWCWQPDHVHLSRAKPRGAPRPADCSAWLAAAEDDQAVYLAVRVQDDRHVARTGGGLWRFDSVHVRFLPGDATRPVGAVAFTFALVDGMACVQYGPIAAPRDVLPDVRLWPAAAREVFEKGLAGWIRRYKDRAARTPLEANVAVGIRRDALLRRTTYEIRIPRALLPAPGAPSPVELPGAERSWSWLWDIAISDNDGHGREGALELGSGMLGLESAAGYRRWAGAAGAASDRAGRTEARAPGEPARPAGVRSRSRGGIRAGAGSERIERDGAESSQARKIGRVGRRGHGQAVAQGL